MTVTAHVRWKLLTDLNANAIEALPSIFNFSTGKSFVRAFGGRWDLDFNPHSLSPTNRLYDLLRKRISRLEFVGRKFPFAFVEEHTGKEMVVNAQFRLYGKDLLVIDIALTPLELDNSEILGSLLD